MPAPIGFPLAPPDISAFTGSLMPTTADAGGSINETFLDVAQITAGELIPGAALSGVGVAMRTKIIERLSGATGGVGLYRINIAQPCATAPFEAAYSTMIVNQMETGTIVVGDALFHVAPGSLVRVDVNGGGGVGAYLLTPSQSLPAATPLSGSSLIPTNGASFPPVHRAR